jgi:RNA polymerase sigma factor (sigma-70 family)
VNNFSNSDVNELLTAIHNGDRNALDTLVNSIQKDIYHIALRFLWHPQDAEDATQETLIKVITSLSTFQHKSSFKTWVYKITTNTLLTLKQKRMERNAMSFEDFGNDLSEGLSDSEFTVSENLLSEQLIEEVKVGCTHAMLLCLDRTHRCAYILGEIHDLNHNECAEILSLSPATFRKQLSRAKQRITSFMTNHCGLIDNHNHCKCSYRVNTAIQRGYVNPNSLLFCPQKESEVIPLAEVINTLNKLDESRRIAALFRSQNTFKHSTSFNEWLSTLLDNMPTADVKLTTTT